MNIRKTRKIKKKRYDKLLAFGADDEKLKQLLRATEDDRLSEQESPEDYDADDEEFEDSEEDIMAAIGVEI